MNKTPDSITGELVMETRNASSAKYGDPNQRSSFFNLLPPNSAPSAAAAASPTRTSPDLEPMLDENLPALLRRPNQYNKILSSELSVSSVEVDDPYFPISVAVVELRNYSLTVRVLAVRALPSPMETQTADQFGPGGNNKNDGYQNSYNQNSHTQDSSFHNRRSSRFSDNGECNYDRRSPSNHHDDTAGSFENPPSNPHVGFGGRGGGGFGPNYQGPRPPFSGHKRSYGRGGSSGGGMDFFCVS
ncbi:hypothetical protein LINPERHAP2_LOCUS42930 [Linum perenne]